MFLSLILSSLLTFVELNCENLFDTRHDSLKNDVEFLPEGSYHWTPYRYWHKVNHLGQEIVGLGYEEASGDVQLPDLVALCEVENDSVLFDLTKRSAIRTAGYEYVMTDSPDERGIDVSAVFLFIDAFPVYSGEAFAGYPSYERHSLCFWTGHYGRYAACVCGACTE